MSLYEMGSYQHLGWKGLNCDCTLCYAQRRQQERAALNQLMFQPQLQQLLPIEEQPMNIVERIKNLSLSTDEKLLRKHELVDECGDLTTDGKAILWAILLDTHRETLVAKVREIEAEDKANKKKA